MMFYGVAILVISAIAAGAHLRTPVSKLDERIIGGKPIAIEDVPYQVSVQVRNEHYCGGIIIDKYWILTAGHCTLGGREDEYTIRAGTSNNREGGQVYKVVKTIVHEHFVTTLLTHDFDYALMMVDTPLDIGSSTMNVVPLADKDPEEGVVLLVAGWGVTLSAKGPATEILQALPVPTISREQCRIDYKDYNITERMICAGYEEGGRDSCLGDSGGALVAFDKNRKPYVVGIVSWGVSCALPNQPGIYADVAFAKSWVFEKTGISF